MPMKRQRLFIEPGWIFSRRDGAASPRAAAMTGREGVIAVIRSLCADSRMPAEWQVAQM